MKPKVAIGLPVYGTVSDTRHVKALRSIIDAVSVAEVKPEWVLDARSMMTDHNRNTIVRRFLETDAEWLFWWDSDNTDPIGTLKRLLDANRTLIGGLYVGRTEPHKCIAYNRAGNGMLTPLGVHEFIPGEIVRVTAGGMHSVLSHRSVYEDIAQNYVTFNTYNAGEVSIHREDIKGDVWEDTVGENDGKVIDGIWQVRLRPPAETLDTLWFLQYLHRTEDIHFFECAERVGHNHHIDTSLILGHLQERENTYWEHVNIVKEQMDEDSRRERGREANRPVFPKPAN